MTSAPTPPPVPAPATDPWKGFRGIMAAVLILQAIVVGLTFPVVAKLTSAGITWSSGLYLSLVCLWLILLSGMQRRPQALAMNLASQLLVIGGGFFQWSIAAVGVVFACVWLYIVYLRRDVQRREEQGRLPSQRTA